MARPKSRAFARIRAEVICLVTLIPAGKFTTYGSIAVHMNVMPRHVAFVIARLTGEESARVPWHRVVSADARLSPKMDPGLREIQRSRLEEEGVRIDSRGYIENDETRFHPVGARRDIRWSEVKD